MDLTFPLLVEAGCANELCELGTWAACDMVPVSDTPLDPTRTVGSIERNERFEVSGANTVVRSPGVVRVTQGDRHGLLGHDQVFAVGDTLYVLDYRGEGVFGIWHDGGVFPVRAFWPWEGGRQTAGELLEESRSELWLRVSTEAGLDGWVQQDLERMLDARTLFLREPGPEPCDAPQRDLRGDG